MMTTFPINCAFHAPYCHFLGEGGPPKIPPSPNLPPTFPKMAVGSTIPENSVPLRSTPAPPIARVRGWTRLRDSTPNRLP